MGDDYIIEKVQQDPDGEERERVYFRASHSSGNLDLKTRLKLIALIVGGVAVGTLLFLFFVTLFIYFFIPLVILFAIWSLFNRRRP